MTLVSYDLPYFNPDASENEQGDRPTNLQVTTERIKSLEEKISWSSPLYLVLHHYILLFFRLVLPLIFFGSLMIYTKYDVGSEIVRLYSIFWYVIALQLLSIENLIMITRSFKIYRFSYALLGIWIIPVFFTRSFEVLCFFFFGVPLIFCIVTALALYRTHTILLTWNLVKDKGFRNWFYFRYTESWLLIIICLIFPPIFAGGFN